MKISFLIFLIFLSYSSIAQIIISVAGNGSGGYAGDGAAATSASIGVPGYVATDKQGNIYFTALNNTVRIVHPSGIINTYAGNGTAGFFR